MKAVSARCCSTRRRAPSASSRARASCASRCCARDFLRAFNARRPRALRASTTPTIRYRLGQTPMHSPTVFNFFRPGYTPPNSRLARRLVGRRCRSQAKSSVAGYLNYMRRQLAQRQCEPRCAAGFRAEIAVADVPSTLVERINTLLMSGQMSSNPAQPSIEAAVAGSARSRRRCTEQRGVPYYQSGRDRYRETRPRVHRGVLDARVPRLPDPEVTRSNRMTPLQSFSPRVPAQGVDRVGDRSARPACHSR